MTGIVFAVETQGKQEHKSKRQRPLALPTSELTFEQLKPLHKVLVAFRSKKEPSVDLWRADIQRIHADTQTFDVFVKELNLPLQDVTPDRLFKPSLTVPGV